MLYIVKRKRLCGIVAKWILSTQFGIETKDIGIVNSDEYQKKEEYEEKNISALINKSLGRGIDLSLLTLGINLEVYAGESIFEQQVFRLQNRWKAWDICNLL